ncbi:hypothetical protein ACWDYH_01830 [Nocardia goodfellowii]
MKRSLAAAALAGALILAPMATAHAQPAAPPKAGPVALCPPYCPNPLELLLQILTSGSSGMDTGTVLT